MTGKGFDERQVQIRYRISASGLWLVLGLVLLNGLVVDVWHPWASGVVQALTIVMLPVLYICVRALCSHVYFPDRTTLWWSLASWVGFVLLVYVPRLMSSPAGSIDVWSEGRAGKDYLPTLGLVMFSVLAVTALLCRERKEKPEVPETIRGSLS